MFENGYSDGFRILLHLSRDTWIHHRFLEPKRLIAGLVRVVWPWLAAWWPAGDPG